MPCNVACVVDGRHRVLGDEQLAPRLALLPDTAQPQLLRYDLHESLLPPHPRPLPLGFQIPSRFSLQSSLPLLLTDPPAW